MVTVASGCPGQYTATLLAPKGRCFTTEPATRAVSVATRGNRGDDSFAWATGTTSDNVIARAANTATRAPFPIANMPNVRHKVIRR